jgi:rubredoxin-NAD+ reductase
LRRCCLLEASTQLRDALADLGVRWHFGATVKAVNKVTIGGASAGHLQVELSNGQVALVDAVLSAIGLRADTSLAQAAGLTCERGVVVDAALQTSAPNTSTRWATARNTPAQAAARCPTSCPS